MGPKVLDLGCGRNKHPGSIGADLVPNPGVDLVFDLNHFPYPFFDNTFQKAFLTHVVEHVRSITGVMEEIHRISRPEAEVVIVTPHHTDASSWQNPTHLWHLNSRSFDIFQEGEHFGYISRARFAVERVEIRLVNLFRWIGIEFLVNLQNRHAGWRFLRRFWEQYLCYIIRGKNITFTLRTIK